MNIPDNYDLWERHDRDQKRKLERLPKCHECGEPIQEYAYGENGKYICEDCLNAYYRLSVEDLM